MVTSRMRGLSSTALAHPCYYPRVRLISRAPTKARFDQLTSAEQLDRLTELALEDLYRTPCRAASRPAAERVADVAACQGAGWSTRFGRTIAR